MPARGPFDARAGLDEGTAVEAACRIVILEDQLEEALRINAARDTT